MRALSSPLAGSPRRSRSVIPLAAAFISLSASAPARAHFVLQTPPPYDVLNQADGLPEKEPPCGNEAPQTLSNKVTAYQEGQTITITLSEVVFHPGHYRVAIAMYETNHSYSDAGPSFPPDPPVTPGPTNSGTVKCNNTPSPCGSTTIENPPVFPVIADNLFEHCNQFTAPQTAQITLPPGVTCTKCTLQIVEYMSEHGLNVPGGCFYHHCADISIATGSVVVDGGSSGSGDRDASVAQDATMSTSGSAASGGSGTSIGGSGVSTASGSASGTMTASGSSGVASGTSTSGSSASGSLGSSGTTGGGAGSTASGLAAGGSGSGAAAGGSPSSPPPSSSGCELAPPANRHLDGAWGTLVGAAAAIRWRRRRRARKA